MEAIEQFLSLDFSSTLLSVFIILAGLKGIATLWDWFATKIGLEFSWQRKKHEDHELLINTSQKLNELQSKQSEDTKQSILHDQKIKNGLAEFMEEMKCTMKQVQSEQEELVSKIDTIVSSNVARDNAAMEEMCDRIGQKTRHYISDLHGIPEDEYDDFVRLFHAYKGIGGNHGAEAKYQYCMKHLPVLPIETKIVKGDE